MKKIKSGIRRDFDNIQHKSKEEMLSIAGVASDVRSKKRRYGGLKLLPILAACLTFFMSGVMLAVATTALLTPTRQMFFSNNAGDGSGWISSYTDISETIGRDFYYPTYGVDSEVFPYISQQEERNQIQINYQGLIHYFWIDFDADISALEVQSETVAYEKHGTVFHIREGYDFEIEKLGNYHVSGLLDGDLYTFYVGSVEDAKAVIDGLQKTGS